MYHTHGCSPTAQAAAAQIQRCYSRVKVAQAFWKGKTQGILAEVRPVEHIASGAQATQAGRVQGASLRHCCCIGLDTEVRDGLNHTQRQFSYKTGEDSHADEMSCQISRTVLTRKVVALETQIFQCRETPDRLWNRPCRISQSRTSILTN